MSVSAPACACSLCTSVCVCVMVLVESLGVVVVVQEEVPHACLLVVSLSVCLYPPICIEPAPSNRYKAITRVSLDRCNLPRRAHTACVCLLCFALRPCSRSRVRVWLDASRRARGTRDVQSRPTNYNAGVYYMCCAVLVLCRAVLVRTCSDGPSLPPRRRAGRACVCVR